VSLARSLSQRDTGSESTHLSLPLEVDARQLPSTIAPSRFEPVPRNRHDSVNNSITALTARLVRPFHNLLAIHNTSAVIGRSRTILSQGSIGRTPVTFHRNPFSRIPHAPSRISGRYKCRELEIIPCRESARCRECHNRSTPVCDTDFTHYC
jgi:hypothetical protein